MNVRQRQATWYVAESRGGDAARSVRLGGVLVPTRRLALRWLRRQARRFADALDPDPYTPWVPGGALYPVGVAGLRDAPAELRYWATSFREHDYALGRLADGLPYEFVARDTAAWYGLVMRPLVPARASVPLSSLRQG
ncbi:MULTISPECIES: hypothetical protein [Streptomyces]|uniref:hypothetical protein n=1 Tax=Streptomyces TaxID=1883 RepID=UPI000241A062|nr:MULTISPECIES: hypothetical protein [Streptomyces]EHM28261.1 hypothetical protein SPW_3285 [Streptomyces sp. W007]MCX4520478.1 hypothetical protein [Streptomyces anulatus]MCX4603347.1 hypothetical protein [Streptomyces anulatus]WTD25973.1 hypothetical protein OH737_16155 [Streptomyces anulatus]